MATRKRTLLKVIILGDSGCVLVVIAPWLFWLAALPISQRCFSDLAGLGKPLS